MGIFSIAFALAMMLATIESAGAAVVLSENFDDVISLGNVSNSGTPNVCLNSPCTSNSPGLPVGTRGNSNTGPAPAGANTAPDNSNIRRGDNTINTSTGINGFDSFFAPTSSNGFLVLGDDTSTVIDGSPNNGLSFTRIPFAIPVGLTSATVAFSWAFEGQDASATADDTFTAHILNSAGTSLATLLSRTSGSATTGYGTGNFVGTWGPGSSFAPGSYYLELRLQEQTANATTQSALGIDDITVTAVPEPNALLVMLAGCGVLAFYARRGWSNL